MTNMEERYIATVVLHAVGDMIGFKNGEWEFNFNKKTSDITLNTNNEILYDFISLGGINDIDFSKWWVSDDTIMHLVVIDSLLEYQTDNNFDSFYKYMHGLMKGAYLHMVEDEKNGKHRFMGDVTQRYIKKLSPNTDKILKDARHMPYDPMSGGAGAAMRTSCIGLAYNGEENRNKLIELSIESSRMTHNSPIGYLGGLTVALFVAFAIEGIDLYEWPYKLLEILESDKSKQFIRKNTNYEEDEIHDYETYISYWQRYIDTRFDDNIPIKTRAHANIIYRIRYHYNNFTADNSKSMTVGDTGYSAPIMAYDALLDCDKKWEPLIVYSALHIGDSDTVACIACSWFGALYGFKNIPESNIKYLEFKKDLFDNGKKLYKKYYLHEKI
jgi:ADP-ribosylarginine hydrolase